MRIIVLASLAITSWCTAWALVEGAACIFVKIAEIVMKFDVKGKGSALASGKKFENAVVECAKGQGVRMVVGAKRLGARRQLTNIRGVNRIEKAMVKSGGRGSGNW